MPEALEAIDKSIFLNRKKPDAVNVKNALLIKLGKYDEAMETLNKGLEMMPGDATFIYNKACIYSLKGDKANALSHLKTAIATAPWLKQQAMQDEDFRNLREDAEFKALVK
jgi:Flp pilus assembly protein TadD